MGALLKVGRVGLDVSLNSPQEVEFAGREDGRQVVISGYLRASSLAETKVLRSELLAQVGQLVPVTYSTDDGLDGVVLLQQASVDLSWRDGALQGEGFFRFELQVDYIGSYAETEFQSLLSMVSAAEDFTTDEAFWHSPPVGTRAYSAGGNQPTLIERVSEDGNILFAYEIPTGTHPTWSVDPANYYLGAVEFWAGGYLRAGRDMPMDVIDWEINAKTLRVRAGRDGGGTSDGTIEFAAHDGTAWGSWVPFKIFFLGVHVIPEWHFVTCVRNTPEAVTVRLIRDAVENNPSTAKHELDITVRRGGRLVSCVYKFDAYTGATGHSVFRSAVSAATRPGGTASYMYFDTLVDGDRWILGCPKAFTADTTNGGLQIDTPSQNMPFWVAVAVDNAASTTGDGPADLAEQYVGQVAESVRAVRR